MLIGLSIAEFLEAIIFGKIVGMTLMIGLPIVCILLQIPGLKLRKLLKQYINKAHNEKFKRFQRRSALGVTYQKYYYFLKSKEFNPLEEEMYFMKRLHSLRRMIIIGIIAWLQISTILAIIGMVLSY